MNAFSGTGVLFVDGKPLLFWDCAEKKGMLISPVFPGTYKSYNGFFVIVLIVWVILIVKL